MSFTIYRIQDKDGRGPYKLGFSHKWTDADRDESLRPPFFVEFGMNVLSKALYGQHCGCAFRSIAQLKAWFSANEIYRLESLGYHITKMEADAVLGESERQLVFARNRPLKEGAKRILIIRAADEKTPTSLASPPGSAPRGVV